VADIRRKSMKVLVGDSESDAVLAQFGEHICQGHCRGALKFIDESEELSLSAFRDVSSAVGG
jgi:hypothetical protein